MYLIQGILRTELPFRVFLPDGSSRTCLNELAEAQLAELDIYPVDEIRPDKLATQYYGEPTITISDGRATSIYPVIDYSETELAEILAAVKEPKIAEINEAFEAHISGRTTISLGWGMQFKLNDILMVDGAVRALEMTGGTEGYLTDADNVNHYGLSVQQMKQAVLEMTVAHMQAHAHKQQLRDLINSATSIESLDGVVWLL